MQSCLVVMTGSYCWIKVVIFRYWKPDFRQLIYVTVSFEIVYVATLAVVLSIMRPGNSISALPLREFLLLPYWMT